MIGHYALERPDLGAVAEASDAIVAVEYRHHHLLEEMRPLLREEAKRLGLTGLVGYPVTNHLFLKKPKTTSARTPAGSPGAVAALLPQHARAADAAHELRNLLRLPGPAAHVVHVATPHREMISRIYQQYGISPEMCETSPT